MNCFQPKISVVIEMHCLLLRNKSAKFYKTRFIVETKSIGCSRTPRSYPHHTVKLSHCFVFRFVSKRGKTSMNKDLVQPIDYILTKRKKRKKKEINLR